MLIGTALDLQCPAIQVDAGLRYEVCYALYGVLGSGRAWTPTAQLLGLHERLGAWPEMWLGIVDLPGALEVDCTFDDLMECIAGVPAEQLIKTLVIGMLHSAEVADAIVAGDLTPERAIAALPPAKSQWLAHVGLYPFDRRKPAGRFVASLLDEPEQVRDATLETLDLFWRGWFAGFWRDNETHYRAAARAMARDLGAGDFETAIALNRLPVEVDHGTGEICALRGGYRSPVDEITEVRLMPSAFNTGRFWDMQEVAGRQIACFLVHHPSLCVWESEPEADRGVDLALVCRALGNSSRVAIADLLAEQPRSASEIAETLGLSKSTVSHHLFLMREAGLIDEEMTTSRSIILTLRREVFLGLPNAAMRRFFSRDGT